MMYSPSFNMKSAASSCLQIGWKRSELLFLFVGTQKNFLNEMVLLGTKTIVPLFNLTDKKIFKIVCELWCHTWV